MNRGDRNNRFHPARRCLVSIVTEPRVDAVPVPVVAIPAASSRWRAEGLRTNLAARECATRDEPFGPSLPAANLRRVGLRLRFDCSRPSAQPKSQESSLNEVVASPIASWSTQPVRSEERESSTSQHPASVLPADVLTGQEKGRSVRVVFGVVFRATNKPFG